MTAIPNDDVKPFLSRGCFTFLATVTVLVATLAISISYVRERQRIVYEHENARRRQSSFDHVKNGDHRVTIGDGELLQMLASDERCIANLDELDFSMTEITLEQSRHISQLRNVKAIYFYSTRGADNIIENAKGLPVERMGFEMARLSDDSLRALAEFSELKEVHFEHVMYPNEMEILVKLPPRIEVRIPYPAQDQPGFKERGEPVELPTH